MEYADERSSCEEAVIRWSVSRSGYATWDVIFAHYKRYYPMRGFKRAESAARFCRAFDEQRQYFRLRTKMRQRLPPLPEQRREFCVRFQALMGELMAA
jgi:hypothetical protein